MDCFFKLLVIGVPIIVILGLSNERKRRRRIELYGNLARGLHMKFDEATVFSNRRISGMYNGKNVRVEDGSGGSRMGYKVTMESKSQFSGHITLERPGYGELGRFLVRSGFSMREGVIEFGDPQFDRTMVAWTSNPEFFKGVIDARVRKSILELSPGKITVSGGRLTYDGNGYMPNNLANIKMALKTLDTIDRRLCIGAAPEKEEEPYDEESLLKF